MKDAMQDVGWGIVGCGDVAERKAGRAFSAPGSRLVAVMRRDAEAARAFAERYGAGMATTSAAEMLRCAVPRPITLRMSLSEPPNR